MPQLSHAAAQGDLVSREMPLELCIQDFLGAGDGVLEVGAHSGSFALAMSRLVGREGQVHAFEASPFLLPRLRCGLDARNASNVILVPRAAWSRSETLLPFACDDASFRSDGRPARDGATAKEMLVETITLDDYCASRNLHPRLLKLTAAGTALSVLQGARRLLASETLVIVLKYTARPESDEDALEFLKPFGYQFYDVNLYQQVERSFYLHAFATPPSVHILALPPAATPAYDGIGLVCGEVKTFPAGTRRSEAVHLTRKGRYVLRLDAEAAKAATVCLRADSVTGENLAFVEAPAAHLKEPRCSHLVIEIQTPSEVACAISSHDAGAACSLRSLEVCAVERNVAEARPQQPAAPAVTQPTSTATVQTLRLPAGCHCCHGADVACIAVLQAKHLLRCGNCGVYFFAERPTAQECEAHYQGSYSEVHQQQLHDLLKGDYDSGFFAGQVENMCTYHRGSSPTPSAARPQKLRVLDFGCGPGYFLKACMDRGFDAYGIEHDRDVARFNTKLGIKMIDLDELARLPDDSFDCIRANHVIEHLDDPRSVLELFQRKIQVGGIFLASSPSFSPVLVGANALKLRDVVYPDHLFYFTCKSFAHLLAETGFRVEVDLAQFALPSQAIRLLGLDGQNAPVARRILCTPLPDAVQAVHRALEEEPFKAGSNLFFVARKLRASGNRTRTSARSPAVQLHVQQAAAVHLVETLGLPLPAEGSLLTTAHCGRRGQLCVVDRPAAWHLLWPYTTTQGRAARHVFVSGTITLLEGQAIQVRLLGPEQEPLGDPVRTFPNNDTGSFEFAADLAGAPGSTGCYLCVSSTELAELVVQDLLFTERAK